MAKKTAKAKAASASKKTNAPKPQEPPKKAHSNAVALFLATIFVVLATLILLKQFNRDNYHTPPVGYIDIQKHEETPVQVELLSLHPKVYMLRNVLTDAECEDIITQARQSPARSRSTSGGSQNKTHEWRRSTTAWLRKDEQHASSAVKKLVSRVAAAANVSTASLQRGNPLHVTEYEPGGFYLPHTDSKHLDELEATAQEKTYEGLDGFVIKGGYPHSARYFTGLCYLSDDFQGGQTIFPLFDNNRNKQPDKGIFLAMQNSESENTMANWKELLPSMCKGISKDGMSVPPTRGSCVLFYNHFVDEDDGFVGELDRQSLHAGCTVNGGNKWIANVWAEAIPSNEAKRMTATGNSKSREL